MWKIVCLKSQQEMILKISEKNELIETYLHGYSDGFLYNQPSNQQLPKQSWQNWLE